MQVVGDEIGPPRRGGSTPENTGASVPVFICEILCVLLTVHFHINVCVPFNELGGLCPSVLVQGADRGFDWEVFECGLVWLDLL